MRNVSDKSCRGNQNTDFVVPLMRESEKKVRTGQATDDNMAHALCVLDT